MQPRPLPRSLMTWISLLSSLASVSALGVRETLTVPVEASSFQWSPSREDNRGPTASSCTIRFSFVNLSRERQTVTAQLLDQHLHVGYGLANRTGLSGWSVVDSLWVKYDHTRAASDRKTVTLDPRTSGGLTWSIHQRGTLNASSGFTWDSPGGQIPLPWTEFSTAADGNCLNAATKGPNLVCAATVALIMRATVEIAEDRGAVSGTMVVYCGLNNGTSEIVRSVSYPLNAGRPF